ncbi:hypothetical protein HUS70_17080 [Pandoraea nosoerga]|nr:hypothetical protein [Pandoraea nosoerga]MBN4667182.1 hypothetical protein [Pandoraea nosoerga]MBN4677169.1 hypothetical protein [Pandoraea nosoerga]MBN4682010.1 hypothetical protein [Pandoraea nosoerga]MBN4746328.1 hypothetical protein [Pandoraea nosoerga]
MNTVILHPRRGGRRVVLRHILMVAIRHHDAVLANCALQQLDGLAGAW